LAAVERFGGAADLVPLASIPAVFEEVNRKQVNCGLVPIENSTDGRVVDTLGMFARLPVRICGEVQLWIHHNLLARCDRSDVTEVYSRPQALSQCRNWLSKHLPSARVIEVTSTSTAAQLTQDKPGVAAIASKQAAVHYGLNVLVENIEDNQANLTRFAVIGEHPGARTGHDKTALMFELEHRPGSLADAMAVFKRNRLNMTWIESFPIPQKQGGYLFFVELAGHEGESRVRRATDALARRTVRFTVLGSYARSEPLG
jgi:chorismate mutase/prephenate dehydratase